jgi:hypothetical protein
LIAWLGVIGTVLGIVGFLISDLPRLLGGEATPAPDHNVSGTLAVLEREKFLAELQLTQIALDDQRAANQSTQAALDQQQVSFQATLDAAAAEQANLVATSNAVAALTATADAANAQATQAAQDATATANFLAQLTPTNTPVPTATPLPPPATGHRSIEVADVGVSDGSLLFAMRTAQPIPDEPQAGLAYIWALDTDRDPETGLALEDIGVDKRVTVTFESGAWLGTVGIVQADGTLGETFRFLDIEINGTNLIVRLDPDELGLPLSFDWAARVEAGGQVFSPFPESGHLTLES